MKNSKTILRQALLLLVVFFVSAAAMAQPTPTTPITSIVDIDGNGSRDYVYVIGADVWVDKLHNGTYSHFPGLGVSKIYNGIHQMDATPRSEVLFIQEKLAGTTYTYTISVLYSAVVNGPVLKKAVALSNVGKYGIQLRDMDASAGAELLFYDNNSAQVYTFTPNTVWKVVPTYGGTPLTGVTIKPIFTTLELAPGNGVAMVFIYHYLEIVYFNGYVDATYTSNRVYKAKTKTLSTLGQNHLAAAGWYCNTLTPYLKAYDHTSATSQARLVFYQQKGNCPGLGNYNVQRFNVETAAITEMENVALATVNAARPTPTGEAVITIAAPAASPNSIQSEMPTITGSTQLATEPKIDVEPTFEQNGLAGETAVGIIEKEQLVGKGFALYPNVTTGIIKINTTAGESIEKLTIADGQGRIVYASSGNYKQFDISKLAKGVYFYQVKTSYNKYTGKLVKE